MREKPSVPINQLLTSHEFQVFCELSRKEMLNPEEKQRLKGIQNIIIARRRKYNQKRYGYGNE